MQDPVPPREPAIEPGIKPGPPAFGAWSLMHWTIREVPICIFVVFAGGGELQVLLLCHVYLLLDYISMLIIVCLPSVPFCHPEWYSFPGFLVYSHMTVGQSFSTVHLTFWLGNSLLWGVVLCTVECLTVSLASICWMSVVHPPSELWQPKMSPDCQISPGGKGVEITPAENHWSRSSCCWWKAGYVTKLCVWSGLEVPHSFPNGVW